MSSSTSPAADTASAGPRADGGGQEAADHLQVQRQEFQLAAEYIALQLRGQLDRVGIRQQQPKT